MTPTRCGSSSVGRARASQKKALSSRRVSKRLAADSLTIKGAAARIAAEFPLGLGAVAADLGVSVSRVQKLIESGPLFAFRSGGELLVKPSRLAQFKRLHPNLAA